ncbi:helix-turn-helix domain-containing protein [Schleiferilactobacillus harbinensis]|uniref:helix-turn-helix domain-containing protein n=1 Tax=Schleiferilactobacillus harbinensis TaxID=304207 RepID=UPI0011753210|nr:helix-turn-helix transcriptional regulator [Schleiferilactobacillus harbinensis]GEK06191.1 hypothetical protein LHA01_14300 [Schleiferilactobacillus harbinensis]
MLDEFAQKFGLKFHEIRVRRRLTIEQVRGGLEASTVSRFERGQTMLSTTNLIALLHAAGMSATEFFNIVGAIRPTAIERLMDEVQLANRRQDAAILVRAMHYLLGNTEGTLPAQILALVVNSDITRIKVPDYHFSGADQDQIEDYLKEQPAWFKLEYFIFNQAIPSLTPEMNDRLYRDMVRSYAAIQLPEYTELVGSSLAKLAVVWLLNGDWNKTYQMINDAKQFIVGSGNVLITYRAQLIELAANYLDSRDEKYLAEVKSMLAFFRTVDAEIYQADRNWLRLLHIPVD